LACIKAKLPPIHPHQLRHYFATKTLEHGAKLEVISKILGHADVAITAQVYRHIQVKEYHSEINTHGQALQLGDGKPIIEGEAKLLPPAKEQNDKPHT
jgi:integrase